MDTRTLPNVIMRLAPSSQCRRRHQRLAQIARAISMDAVVTRLKTLLSGRYSSSTSSVVVLLRQHAVPAGSWHQLSSRTSIVINRRVIVNLVTEHDCLDETGV
jgi:hypothetical protein